MASVRYFECPKGGNIMENPQILHWMDIMAGEKRADGKWYRHRGMGNQEMKAEDLHVFFTQNRPLVQESNFSKKTDPWHVMTDEEYAIWLKSASNPALVRRAIVTKAQLVFWQNQKKYKSLKCVYDEMERELKGADQSGGQGCNHKSD
ncbi:unnamed protein product [Amoebophrya sp. A120]|nr:unnamed protein product [Amoebophrya sp. A120]|eukprot:GSA120T00024680001.1